MAMMPRKMLGALLGVVVLLGVLTTFAVELSNTQARNAADVRARVHERAVLAGALIDGLFATVTQQTGTDQKLYGGKVVRRSVLNAQKQTDTYLAVLDSSGRLLAGSRGLTPSLARQLPTGAELKAMAARHETYHLGNVGPVGSVINFSVPFPTRYGERVLVSGFTPGLLGVFLMSDLKKIPGVKGAVNYVLDGNGVVLASSSNVPAGSHFQGPHPGSGVRNFDSDTGGRYYDEVKLNGSDWRIAIVSPDGPLYANVSGLNKWLPWVIFAAFALVALAAFGLVWRVLRAGEETRSAYAQLATVNRELETSNRMLAQRAAELARSNEELDQFASIASHDLQEPLRKVRTFTQELTRMEGASLSDKGRDYLERANGAAARMQTLIEDLLKFSRVSTHAEAFTGVDLGQVVEDVLIDLSNVVEQAHAVVHVGTLPTVSAEPLQMRQLMQNLLSNAVKFHAADRTPEVWVDSTVEGEEARITVRDNGIGFDQRYAARIFRVFERLHGRSDYAGTGIGLALCRKIVERHGGAIAAEGAPGEGATFTVTLPLHPTGAGGGSSGQGDAVLVGAIADATSGRSDV